MSTPRVVLNALIPDAVGVGEFNLQPLTLGTYLLLEKIDSPFVNRAPASGNTGSGVDSLDIARTLYILTRQPAEVRPLYERFDRASFEDAVWKFLLEVHASELTNLLPRLQAIFSAATSTVISGGGDATHSSCAEAKKKNSSRPAARMDSVGA